MSKLYDDYINRLKTRFNMSSLVLETDAPKDTGEELSELIRQREREEQSKYSLCYGSTRYKNAPVRIYFDKSRVQKVLI